VEQQMASLVTQTATPLEKVPDLGEQLIAKLNEAGITTVEALADMTPEQLEELPGVGPKTVEKISIAVNNYFSSLEAEASAPAEEGAQPEAVEVQPEGAGVPAAEAQAAEVEATEAQPEGTEVQTAEVEAAEVQPEIQEAEANAGVENAAAADVEEVHTHGDNQESQPGAQEELEAAQAEAPEVHEEEHKEP
jgi:transcription termination/antitermination protein NusA